MRILKKNLSVGTSADQEPFFVVGAARSGSTMLRLMLNRHPMLAVPPESHFLIPLLQTLPCKCALNPEQVQQAAMIITKHPRFSAWCTPAEKLTEAFLKHPDPTLGALVDTTYRLEIRPTGKSCWGDKTPQYASIIDSIDSLFPRARFIHIVRDGRDTSLSLRNVRWYGWIEYERAQYWKRTVRTVESVGARIGPSRYTHVFYEDLVLSPEATLQGLCNFLEIPMHESMLSFHEDALDHISEEQRNSGDHRKVARPPRQTDVARWRRESSWFSVLLFEAIAGKALGREGYNRRFTGSLSCLTAVAWAVYSPIGASVAMVHRLFDSLPDSTQSFFRNNRVLRRLKRSVIRC